MAERKGSVDLSHEFVQSADTPVPGRPRWAVIDHVVNVVGWLHRRGPFSSSYWLLYKVLDDWTSRLVLWTGIVLAITAGVPLPLMAVVFRSVIDSFPPREDQVIHAISQIIGIACAYFVVTFGWTVCWGVVGGRISVRLQQRLLRRVIGMDMAFFDSNSSKISSVLAADTQTVQRGTSEKVGLFIQSMSYFGATFVTAFVLSPALTGILFAVVVPTILFLVTVGGSFVSRFAKQASKLSDEATAIAENAIHSVKVVQAFGALNVLSDEHTRLLRQSTRYAYRKSVMGAMMLAAVYFLCYAVNALAFYVGFRFGGSSGTIYAVVFLILDASFILNQVGPFLQNMAMAATAGARIMDIIQSPHTSIDVYSEKGHAVDSNVLSGNLEFQNVSFAYPSSPATSILRDVNIKLTPGSFTGVVGSSGSGKSTLASLLLRFYDPVGGNVLFNGIDVKDLHLSSFRSHIGFVDQSQVLFDGSVLDNIKVGIPNSEQVPEEEILERCIEAAHTANADFISDLQDGIYTRVSNNTGLSGGQQQRICLARAIVRDPSILVLDEPTSALDSYSESKILEALDQLSKHGRTIFMIAHRLATVKNASNIIVMDRGSIVEQGNHDALMDYGKVYKSLVQAQRLARPTITAESSIADLRDVTTIQVADLRHSASRVSRHSRRGSGVKPLEETRTASFIVRCLTINKPESLLIIIALFASAICGCLIVGESIVFGHLISTINTVTDTAKLQHDVDFLSLMFFVVSLVALVGYGTSGSCFGLMSETFLIRVRDASLRTILKQDQAWFQDPNHSPTKLVASMVADANNVSGLSGVIIGAALALAANMISGFTTSLVSAWKISLVLFTFFPAVIAAGYLRVKMLTMFEHRHTEDYKQAASMASEACLNVRTVAAFGTEEQVLREYSIAVTRPYEKSFRYNVLGNFALAFSYSIIFFVYPLAYWWGSRLVRNGEYSQLDFFITLPSYLITAQQSGQFFTMAPEITAARAAAVRIFKLLDQHPTIMKDAETYQPTDFLEMEKTKLQAGVRSTATSSSITTSPSTSELDVKGRQGARVEFQQVSLKYETKPNRSVLKDLDFTIEPGQLVGLVGPSGAGKSSIIALLERFYDPVSGRVFVNGIDIRSLPVGEHRAKISIVPQEADMFSGSVAFNIGLGAAPGEKPTRIKIEEICKSCGVHDFISSLSEGYDTEVGPRGSRLSGGQRQRVAIARALLRDPQILLLDEATSALDSHSEKEIQKAILAARQNRTTIVVAHRLSTVAEADTIFVFDKGRLVDEGTHAELLAHEGLYSIMAQAQMID